MLDYNMKTFGKVAIGVHGKELPKFYDNDDAKEWWKKNRNYQENPTNKSAKVLLQERKFWGKQEPYVISDTHNSEGPKDPFKSLHVKQQRRNLSTEKIT